jgi:hypothetical protein
MAQPTQEQIEQAIASIIDGGASSYSIGNRSVSKLDPAKLYELAQKIAFNAERRAGKSPFSVAKIGRTSR